MWAGDKCQGRFQGAVEQRSSRDFQRLLIESYRVDEFDVLLEGSASHQQNLVNLVTDSDISAPSLFSPSCFRSGPRLRTTRSVVPVGPFAWPNCTHEKLATCDSNLTLLEPAFDRVRSTHLTY